MSVCAKCGVDVLGRRKGVPLKYCSKACRYACNVGRKRLPEDVRSARKKASNAAWRARNVERENERRRAFNAANRELVSSRNRERKFGLSRETLAGSLASQGGGCEVCETPLVLMGAKGASDLAQVDHDHRSGAVRGLLCRSCNLSIGHMKDSPERLRAAAAYIEKHRGAR